jgi:hypothetical protein
MRKVLTLTLAATTAISAVAFSTAASAYDYRDYYYRGHDNNDVAGAAIAAGVVGLILGAALASSSNHHSYDNGYGGYYNRGYGSYGQPYYGGYGQPYYGGGYSQPYYGGGYYGGGGYGYQRCYTTRSWDPYSGRQITRQVCR